MLLAVIILTLFLGQLYDNSISLQLQRLYSRNFDFFYVDLIHKILSFSHEIST